MDVNFKIKVIVNIFDTTYISGEDLHSTSKWNVICQRLQERTTNLRKHTDTIQKANSNYQN